MRTLEPSPDRRPASASALAADLQRFLKGQRVHSVGVAWYEYPALVAFRHPMAMGVGLVLSVLMFFIIWTIRHHDQQKQIQWNEPLYLLKRHASE